MQPPARALALLAALASPVFMAAAIAAWVLGWWPANGLTLLAAAAAVLGGPAVAFAHLWSVERPRTAAAPARAAVPAAPAPAQAAMPGAPAPARPARPARAPEPPVPAELAASRAFLAWRDRGAA